MIFLIDEKKTFPKLFKEYVFRILNKFLLSATTLIKKFDRLSH